MRRTWKSAAWKSAALVAATYAVASCRMATTGSEGQEESAYVLRRVAGKPIPAQAFGGVGFTADKLADTIWLRPDGTGREVTVERSLTSESPPVESRNRYDRDFHYRVGVGGFALEFECPPTALCVRPPHYSGTLTPARLRLDYALSYRVPMEFERIAR